MKINFLLLCVVLVQTAWSQNTANFWQAVSETNLRELEKSDKTVQATQYRTLSLDLDALKKYVRNAPLENTTDSKNRPLYLDLPLPDGTMETFAVVESPIMEPELAARYPSIKTYTGQSIKNQLIKVRFGYTSTGFQATIQSEQETILIDAYSSGSSVYTIYKLKDAIKNKEANTFICGNTEILSEEEIKADKESEESLIELRSIAPINLRKYRLAISTSGEFAQRFNVTTKPAMMDLVTNIINRVNSLYEREVAIRFILVNNTDSVFYLNSTTDPYVDAGNINSTLLSQTGAVIKANLGNANYDIGHLITVNNRSGRVAVGLAQLSSTCKEDMKGQAASNITNINTDPIEIMAHELGHQFSANHTFSNCADSQLREDAAYEPGSGSTIMAYAGSCDEQNVQTSTSDYFHTKSLEEIINYSRKGAGAGCATEDALANAEPVITLPYQDGFYIPISTPFELTAIAMDEDRDALTYCWEQFDLGPVSSLGTPFGNAPSFRSFSPTASPNRVFPRIQTILQNTSTPVEVLPTYDRDLTFRATVRDNHPGAGATVWKQVKFKSTSSAGPFLVLHPNEDTVRWTAGTYTQVRWDVARTTNNLVNCQVVNIRLSTDAGLTYPYLLVKETVNNGAATIPVPNVAANQARVRVEAANNIFFDISNQNFQIQAATQPSFLVNVSPRAAVKYCLTKPLQFEVSTEALLGFNSPLTLDITGSLPTGLTAKLSKTNLLPTEGTTLTIDYTQQIEGTFTIQVRATAASGQVVSIPVTFTTVRSDFSNLRLLAPTNGQSGITLSTTFTWSRASSAASYDFELATSPTFGNTVIAKASNLQDTFYKPAQVLLAQNELYYWRIRPYSDCGAENFLEPSVFHTAAVQCSQTTSTNVPLNISGTGLPTVNSTLNIPTSGTINDVNIPLIKAEYSPVKSLRVSLISPSGTEVILYDQHCGNTLRFESGFDDEAPTAVTAVCPPDDRLVVRPTQALAAFKGQNTAGTWTLRTKVMTPGSGGAVSSWNIEFCSTLNPNNPFLVKNDTLKVPPGKTNPYTKNQLEVQDTDNSAAQLKFTLVTLPKNGTLVRGSSNLNIGDTFTQEEVTNFQLKYTHNGSNTTSDSFTFVVEDGTGGWLPTQRAYIKIDANATVGVNDLLDNNKVTVFPNPTRDLLNVQFLENPKGSVNASIFNAQGQEVLRQSFNNAAPLLQINVNNLPSGIYFLALRTADGLVTKKVTIQK